jgi:hypothetical protein
MKDTDGRIAVFKPCKVALTAGSVVFWPGFAWALQTHPEPEGLYSHMLAHLFLIATLGLFCYWLQTTGLVRERGWRLIQVSCFLFILWNLDTFTVHWVEHTMTKEMFVTAGLDWTHRLLMTEGWRSWIYYVGKFDHLLCVPAILVLFIGLRNLYRKAEAERFLHND